MFFQCLSLSQNTYAKHGGDDDGYRHGRGRHGYHGDDRHYSKDNYFYKEIYYHPQKRHYYYYDLYPEKIHYYDFEKEVYPFNSEYLSVISIANMAEQGLPDAVIIFEIERTRSVYKLDSEAIVYLQQNNVSDAVIDYMFATGD